LPKTAKEDGKISPYTEKPDRFESFVILIDSVHKCISKIKQELSSLPSVKSVHTLWLYELLKSKNGLTPSELAGKSNPFMDTTVVVTGTFNNFSREGILDLLTALGARTSVNVTEDTDYLIYGAVPGSRKVGLAIKYGVNMLSEDGFAQMLAK